MSTLAHHTLTRRLIAALIAACTVSTATLAEGGTLYGVDNQSNQLITIDPTTGAGTAVAPLGSISGLTYDPISGDLLGVAGAQLVSINTTTGATTPIGAGIGFSIGGIAAHPITGALFGVSSINDILVSIDRTTGVGTEVGPFGGGDAFANVTGLAFNPTGQVLYAVENGNDQLLTLNTATGEATGIGTAFSVGGLVVTALAFDPQSGELYGSDIFQDQLVSIDPNTGVGTPVGPVGFDIVEGLAFVPIPEPAAQLLALIASAVAVGWRRQ